MAGIEALFTGGGAVEQIAVYGVLQQLLSGLLAPYSRELENLTNGLTQAVPLSPADLATLVIRNYRSLGNAIDGAKQNGISPDDFTDLVHATGNPPAPEALAEALRRGYITLDDSDPLGTSYQQGIRQGDLQDKWADVVRKLATQIPSAIDIIEALIKGQISPDDGRAQYETVGGAPEYFDLLLHTAGQGPTPNEAATMANRGIIPWEGNGPDETTFEQAFHESAYRNKWLDAWRKMAEYFPPPRTIVAMLREGSLTDEQGLALLKQQGLSDVLAGAYLASAKHQRVAAHHQLSLSIVEQLYVDKAISRSDAESFIGDLGYDAQETAFILSVNDLKRLQANINRALNTIHTSYINHKIDRATASNDIDALGIASDARDEYLSVWDIESTARVALLTPTQIRKAAKMDPPLIDAQAAIDRLTVWGYSPSDAAIFMQL